MSPTSPTRDSHSPPVPISSDTSFSLPYSSLFERAPNFRGTSSVDPSSPATYIPPFTSPTRQPPQQQAEAGASHAPSSPSTSASPQRRLSGANQDRRMQSPSSSSQGDVADTEMESGPSSGQHAGQNQPQGPPPKKKRTRTLTTPHQSAVLHALLAQSRFPTTAMREEVGRQIGLSARKVQIWFQNQRQKARRPQGQNTQPQRLDRPPQFGPFPSYPLPAHSTEPLPTSMASVRDPHWSSSLPVPGRHDAHSSTSGSPLETGGPSDLHPRRTMSPRESLSRLPASPTHQSSLVNETRHPLLDPPHRRDLPPQEGSLNLPPLVQAGVLSPSSDHPPLGLPSLRDVPSFRRSLTGLPPSSPTTTTFPPPFTLEPQPQWEPEIRLPITSAWRRQNHTTPPDSRRLSSDSFLPNLELTRSPEPERTTRQPESHAGGGRVPSRSMAARFDPIRSSRNNSLPSLPRSSHPNTSTGRRHSDDPPLNNP